MDLDPFDFNTIWISNTAYGTVSKSYKWVESKSKSPSHPISLSPYFPLHGNQCYQFIGYNFGIFYAHTLIPLLSKKGGGIYYASYSATMHPILHFAFYH